MKIFRYTAFIILCSSLSGCFVYQNISSWEESNELSKPHLKGNNTATGIEFRLEKKQRFVTLPFLILNYSKKGDSYTPLLKVNTPINNGMAITYFQFTILNSDDSVLFSDTVTDTLRFSALRFDGHNDYMALNTGMEREYRIENLGDSVKVNYILHILNQNRTNDSVEFQNKLLIKTPTKRFGSFF